MNKFLMGAVIVSLLAVISACNDDGTPEAETSAISPDNVFAMPVRQIKDGFTIEQFTNAREEYVALLEQQEGTLIDREIQPFLDFTLSGRDLNRVFIGLTSFLDFATFQQIGDTTSGDIANSFFSTFDFITFQVLQPLIPTDEINIADLAPLGSNQVWEVAVRDLSLYESFDTDDYENRRDAYLTVLSNQSGFVREIQLQSISDPNVVVGMTLYENEEAFRAINNDADFINAFSATGFLDASPLMCLA